MKLLLSTDALPAASFDVLDEACRRRALEGVELTLGPSEHHGIDVSLCPIRQREGLSCIPERENAPVVWMRMPDSTTTTMLMIWAAEAHVFGAGMLITRPVPEMPRSTRVALLHGTDVVEARRAAAWAETHSAGTCWQVDLENRDLATWDEILRITGPHLAHVRLLGAGPEAQAEAPGSAGTGTLLSRLALMGYDGTVALAPSSSEHLDDWKQWLLVGRGWGCGTAAEKKARAAARINS